MDSQVKPYKILKKSGLKIGIFGLGIELNGLVNKTLYKETKYLDPVERAQDMSRTLKKDKNCDLVICLSHLGYNYRNKPEKVDDIEIAEKTTGIDLIIGGHTHTFMDRPQIIKNRDNEPVLINQVGCYGLYLGRIDFFFDSKKRKTANGVSISV